MRIELAPLERRDPDLRGLIRIHKEPSVAKYISVSEEYFDYVTGTENVRYYKIKADGVLAGGIHGEIHETTLYLSICVEEKYRRQGIAEGALHRFLSMVSDAVKTIEVSIDRTNAPSILLFRKLGFRDVGRDGELITFRKSLE